MLRRTVCTCFYNMGCYLKTYCYKVVKLTCVYTFSVDCDTISMLNINVNLHFCNWSLKTDKTTAGNLFS
jgi:hypothetical protein